MMSDRVKNIKLGLFVIIGAGALIVSLYLIGNKQNLFGNTINISADFKNVNGLTRGNNVRFAGIDVGTVENVEILSDSSVRVNMIIEKGMQRFIRKDALASVGTDGLMGNKLININSGPGLSEKIKDGDKLHTLRPIETDEMIRTLNITNENIRVISSNLRNITDRINSKNTLWSLLMDTIVAENLKSSIVNLKLMSNTGVMIAGDLSYFTSNIRRGKGSLGALITDTTLGGRLTQAIVKFEKLSDSTAVLEGDLSGIVKNLRQGKGSIGMLLNDTTFVHDLNKSMHSIEKGANGFNNNMEALKYSWPFKKYFRNQAKKKQK